MGMGSDSHLTAAGRAFHYDTFGAGFTYETGANVELPRGLTLRATYSNAFRAPNIGEMFLGANDVFPLVSDPCSTVDEAGNPRELSGQQKRHCAAAGIPSGFRDSRAQLRAREGFGSTDLDPEKAGMITAGLHYRPSFAENFNLNLNYYHNRIEDEIGSLPAGVILSNCYSQDAPSHCDQIVRDPGTNLISHIVQTNTNVGETETAGMDLEASYNGNSPLGILSARLDTNLLFNFDQFLPAVDGTEVIRGRGYYDLGVFPRWRHSASMDLKWRRASAGLTWELHWWICRVRGRRLQGIVPVRRHRKTGVQGGRFQQRTRPSGDVQTVYGRWRHRADAGHEQRIQPAALGDLQRPAGHLGFHGLRLHGTVPVHAVIALPVILNLVFARFRSIVNIVFRAF